MTHSYRVHYFHLIWSTKNRTPWIDEEMQERLYPYLGGITKNHKGKLIEVGGMPDHIHFKRRAEDPLVMERKQYFAVTAACAVMPKQLFEELGGFDERFWCGWEDMDLCQKINKAGYRIYYEPTSLIYHYESRTEGRYAKEDSNFALYMNRWELGGEKCK